MDTKTIVLTFGAVAAVLIALAALRIGLEKLQVWMKDNPFKAAIGLAAVMTVVVAILAGQNKELVECWSVRKAMCFFPVSR